ncbi:MAG: hypothetical protein FJZ01_18795 [Candidatus Sericytochromatia bacterium]|nr:hypothetical protein [Candidatus Tanganyikabacteria bacterium]
MTLEDRDLLDPDEFNLPRGAATAPLLHSPRTGVFWLKGGASRTAGMDVSALDWAGKPHSPTRYLPDSQIVRISGCAVEIIRKPFEALEPMLTAAYLDLNRLLYIGNRARPGSFMHVHLGSASSLAIARVGTRIAGFSLATHLALGGKRIVIHNATAVDPAIRGQAMAFLLNAIHYFDAFRQAPLGFYSVARTYNPQIYGGLLSAGPYYPRPTTPPPADIRSVGRAIASYLNPDAPYDPDVMVQRGAWKKLHRGEIPRHWSPAVNAYCDRHLRYDEGDGLVVVGRFDAFVIAKVIGRYVWKQWVPTTRRNPVPPG